MRTGVVVTCRNDNYGGNLNRRATFCLNSLVDTFDEVWLIDWNTPDEDPPLLHDIAEDIELRGNINHIVVRPEIVEVLTRYDRRAQKVCEVLARNLGIRRATTDWFVSTNIDIISPKREDLIKTIDGLDNNTFYTLSRRGVDPSLIEEFEVQHWREARDKLYSTVPERHFPEKIASEDDYSIINCCGDFQLAPLHIWHTIRGFEETLVYALYTDTNVQKKAVMHGFDLKAIYSPPAFHIDHGPGGGGGSGANDIRCAVVDAGKTENEETWGFSNVEVEWETL